MKMACIPKITAIKLKITVISLMILIAYQILIKESFKPRLIIQKRSPWKYIIQRLIEDKTIPDYFYPHALEGLKDLKKQIKRQLNDANMTIIILELHFDGHNGDHLLVYVPTDKTVCLLSWHWYA